MTRGAEVSSKEYLTIKRLSEIEIFVDGISVLLSLFSCSVLYSTLSVVLLPSGNSSNIIEATTCFWLFLDDNSDNV